MSEPVNEPRKVEQLRPMVDTDWTDAARLEGEGHLLDDYISEWTDDHALLRARLGVDMRELVESGGASFALAVRCSASYRGKPCSKVLARIWDVGRGCHYIRTSARTSPDGRLAGLAEVVAQRAHGLSAAADLTQELVDDDATDYDGCLQLPITDHGTFVLGCPRHGNVHVYFKHMWDEAISTRQALNVDTTAKFVGYPSE